MAEKRITPDDIARRIRRLVTEDRRPPVLIGGTAGTAPNEPRPAGFKNPMTAAGDLIRGGTSGAAARLPIGTTGHVLTVVCRRAGVGGGDGRIGATRDLLTNGDAADPELVFAAGDVIWIEE